MAAAIHRFSSRFDLASEERSRRCRDAVSGLLESFEGSEVERRMLADALAPAVGLLDRRIAAKNRRAFIMLYPSQNRLVVQHLSKHSKRPHVALTLWAWLFEFVRMEDGEILITREGLTERVGASSRSVDAVLGELVEFGALIRLREPEPGKRGRGTVRYFMNPNVGTHLKGGERESAQAAAPALRIVSLDGSARPSERRSRAPVVAPLVL